jgi:hypothetical protein
MPTKRRPVRARLSLIPFVYRRWLLVARPGALIYLEAERVRALWDEYGEEITQRHIRKWPGTRPANWWRFSAPERWNSSAETQLQYLQRLDLLSAEEKARAHVRPRLRPAAPAQPVSPLETPTVSSHRTAPASGWQLVLINDRVELVQVGPHAGAER